MTYVLPFLLGALSTALFYRLRRMYRLRRAGRVLEALAVKAEDERETVFDWRVQHVPEPLNGPKNLLLRDAADPSIESREEVCLVVTERGFDTAVTTFEADDAAEVCERAMVSRGGVA